MLCINEGEPKLTKTFLLGASTPLVVTTVGQVVVPAILLPIRAVQIGCQISHGSSMINTPCTSARDVSLWMASTMTRDMWRQLNVADLGYDKQSELLTFPHSLSREHGFDDWSSYLHLEDGPEKKRACSRSKLSVQLQ